jgi:hypothetical protein
MIGVVNAAEADILWIGLGAPKQEKLAQRMRDTGFGMRDAGFGVRDAGFGVRDAGYGLAGLMLKGRVIYSFKF